MGIRQYLAGLFGGGPKAQTFDLTNMSEAQIRDFLRLGGSMATASGAVINESSAMNVAAAWRCTNILCGAVASTPLDLIRRESESVRKPATGHPLRIILTVKPNHWQTPGEFRRMMQGHLLLRGNAYARKVMAGKRLLGLIPLHPDRVLVKQNSDMSLTYQVARPDGQMLTLGQRDIFHLRGLSFDGVTGLSLLTHMRESLGLAMQTEQAGAHLFRNGALIPGVLKHPQRLSPEARANLLGTFDHRYAGAENAGKLPLLEEGLDYQSIGMSAEDAQFLQTRDFQRYDVAMFYGVPPHMIGATEKTTSWGSGIEAQGIGFVTYSLNDWFVIWQEGIKRDLISEDEWEMLDARFFAQGLLRGDTKTRWQTYVWGRQWGIYNADEVRALEDMNPRTDGGGGEYADPPNTAGVGHNGGPPLEEDNPDDPSQPAEGKGARPPA